MAKLFGKQRTNAFTKFAFVLGMTVFGLMGISCTNLADTVEGNTAQDTGDGNENNENNNDNNSNNNEPHPTEKVDLEAILTSLGENVILPVYQDFQTAAVALQNAASDYASAVSDDSDDLLQNLQH
jgi:hypothetical protein